MSVLILSSQPGRVFAFTEAGQPAQAFIRLDGLAAYGIFKSIVTRVAVSSACNFQVRHTVGSDKFIYTFGDRIGKVFVTGLSFDAYCDEFAGSLGIERVAAYYNANRLAFRSSPIFMTIGRVLTLRMFLAGLDIDVEDPAQRIWRYQLSFLEVPNSLPRLINRRGGGGGTTVGDGDTVGGSGTGGEVTVTTTVGDGETITIDAAKSARVLGPAADAGGFDPAGVPLDAELGGDYSPLYTGAALPAVTPFSLND